MSRYLAVLILLSLLSGCKVNPYRRTNKIYRDSAKVFARQISQAPLTSGVDSLPVSPYWVGTTNFNLRKPNFVILHHTAQNSCPETLNTFTTERTKVSAHYVICRDGVVHHMLNDYLRAWQAGISKWGNVTDVNSVSIGIELDNNGSEPFAPEQIHSLLRLLAVLKTAYNIPTANFIGCTFLFQFGATISTAVGLSLLSGAHLTLVPKVVKLLADAGPPEAPSPSCHESG